jgi:hypothetical protein
MDFSGFASTLPTLSKTALRPLTALWPPLKERITLIVEGQADQEKQW